MLQIVTLENAVCDVICIGSLKLWSLVTHDTITTRVHRSDSRTSSYVNRVEGVTTTLGSTIDS